LERGEPQETQAGETNATNISVAEGFRHRRGAWSPGGGAIRYYAFSQTGLRKSGPYGAEVNRMIAAAINVDPGWFWHGPDAISGSCTCVPLNTGKHLECYTL